MKGLAKGLIVCAVALAVAIPAQADTDVKFSGQVRLREELDKKDMDSSKTILNFADLRTRVGVEAIVDGNTHAFIQFQDSRRLGAVDDGGNRASGSTADFKNVDIHQAYIQVDELFTEGLGMKIGRFELNFGNQRVFGAVDWSSVGRTWEGGLGWYDHPRFKITGFGLKVAECDNEYYNADFDIAGSYATLKDYHVDLFGFYEYNGDTTGNFFSINQLDRFNVGAYFTYDYESFDIESNAVYQSGQKARGPYNPYAQGKDRNREKIDVGAFMIAAEIGYSFEMPFKARVAAGIDYTSGDDDDTDDTYKAYNNLYYSGHRFNGYMDYFTDVAGQPYENAGLVDMMLRVYVEPTDYFTANGDAHLFTTAVDYLNPLDTNGIEKTKDVGIELDVNLATTYVKGLTIEAGGSVFLAKEAFSGYKNADPGYWFYTTTTVNF